MATLEVLSEPLVATIQKNVMGKLPEWTFHLLQPSSNTWMIKRDKRDSVFCFVGNVLILTYFSVIQLDPKFWNILTIYLIPMGICVNFYAHLGCYHKGGTDPIYANIMLGVNSNLKLSPLTL